MATRTLGTYRIPVRLHKPKARSKAEVAYLQQWQGGNAYLMLPAVGATVVEVQAKTAAEAYRELCRVVLPKDARPIMGKWTIKHFRVEE